MTTGSPIRANSNIITMADLDDDDLIMVVRAGEAGSDRAAAITVATLKALTGFDVHDSLADELSSPAASDRLAASDESDTGDPMRWLSLSGLRTWLQTTISLSAARIMSGTLAIARGGTGGTSASAARTSLGIGSMGQVDEWTGTQAQYDAIATKDSDTYYNIEEE